MKMKIHFLVTKIGKDSGGTIYDSNFYNILAQRYPEIKLYDDKHFTDIINGSGKKVNLIAFNNIYKKCMEEILDCNYLIINSRLYTRFMKINMKKMLRKYPEVQCLIIHHHNNYMSHKKVMRYIHKYFELRFLKAATQLIIPNQYVIDQLQKKYKFNNIICLPSSFEKKQYEISDLDTGNILFVGNVEKRKGLIYGLRAFCLFYQNNKQYKFRIAGKFNESDSYYKALKKFIDRNNMNEAVVFEGRVSTERLNWLYSNSDLLLFPSLLEGYGWVMIEAMGRGVPVVAFDNSAMPYTVKSDYNGMLVENLNWKKMGETIEQLLYDKNKLKKLQQGALKTYQDTPSQKELNSQIDLFVKAWGKEPSK